MKKKMFILVLLCVIILSFAGCGNDAPSNNVASDGSSTQSISETSTVAPPTSSSTHDASSTSQTQSTDGISEASPVSSQSTTDTNSESDKVNAHCKLIIKGKDISANHYVKLNYEYHYAELPLIAIMKELGAKVQRQDISSVLITFDDKEYHLDTTKGTLIEGGGSINILSVAPGSNHGTFYQVIDDEFIIDSDSAMLLLINIMGEKVSIDYDENIVNIG